MNSVRVRRSISCVACLFTCAFAAAASADVRLADVFGDHMVLQRDVPLPIWGRADAGESVSVALADATASTTADANGEWQVTLPPLAARAEAVELRVVGRTTVTIADVLIGDVWLASGQSNMQYSLKTSHDGAEAIARSDRPTIRLATVGTRATLEPLDDRLLNWVASAPATAAKFSAVAWTFGESLQDATKVPVGLIGAYVAGTAAQSWTPRAALESSPELTPYVDALAAARAKAGDLSAGAPTSLYNGMIAPLGRLPIRGVIWYQGESNVDESAAYRTLFPALIRGWRAQWGRDDLPFLFVQLPGNGRRAAEPAASKWSLLREAQTAALDLPATGMVVALDLTPQRALLHPKNKRDIGRRLALAARHVAYGEDVAWRGPSLASAQFDGPRVRVRFSDTGGGLKLETPPGEDLRRSTTQPTAVRGFALAGADRVFHWADATIDGNGVTVTSDSVTNPVALRYGWGGNPEVNLYGGTGLPALPFRTDDWVERFDPPATTQASSGRDAAGN